MAGHGGTVSKKNSKKGTDQTVLTIMKALTKEVKTNKQKRLSTVSV